MLTILPPALIGAAAELMTYPVVQRVRGLDLPRKRFAIDSFRGRVWLTVPAALMWTGFRSEPISKQDSSVSMIFMAGGWLALVFCQGFWLRRRMAETFTPHALSVGELRDRAFAIAEKAGVKLSQIFVYSIARWRLANA